MGMARHELQDSRQAQRQSYYMQVVMGGKHSGESTTAAMAASIKVEVKSRVAIIAAWRMISEVDLELFR
jgi:hypothetical protein